MDGVNVEPLRFYVPYFFKILDTVEKEAADLRQHREAMHALLALLQVNMEAFGDSTREILPRLDDETMARCLEKATRLDYDDPMVKKSSKDATGIPTWPFIDQAYRRFFSLSRKEKLRINQRLFESGSPPPKIALAFTKAVTHMVLTMKR